MLSIYYEYCKTHITAILFMLDFTCKLMEDMKTEYTGERHTDTLGKGISKIMNSNISFPEGDFCWLGGWVGGCFSRKHKTKISRRYISEKKCNKLGN